jgi:hypothetical protein
VVDIFNTMATGNRGLLTTGMNPANIGPNSNAVIRRFRTSRLVVMDPSRQALEFGSLDRPRADEAPAVPTTAA